MMYSMKFVAVVKVRGKVLRESGDVVTLPFGSEYSVLLKNLNSVRAVVKVSVDGTDATEDIRLVVPAYGELELERFIRNGNMKRGNKFKFIERTGAIEQHRGVGVEDGLIRVEYWFEKLPPTVEVKTVVEKHVYHHHEHPWYWPYYVPYTLYHQPLNGQITWTADGNIGDRSNTVQCNSLSAVGSAGVSNNLGQASSTLRSARFTLSSAAPGPVTPQAFNSFNMTECSAPNDNGITVPGGESKQEFVSSFGFPVEDQSQVIVLKLRGEVGGKKVVEAVTTKAKPVCPSCGRANKATSKFCAQCGTALELI